MIQEDLVGQKRRKVVAGRGGNPRSDPRTSSLDRKAEGPEAEARQGVKGGLRAEGRSI